MIDLQKPMKMQVTTFKKVLMISLSIAQYGLFLTFLLKITHYAGYPLPWLFDSPTLFQDSKGQSSYLWNLSLYCLFSLQHIVMSAVKFKQTMASLIKDYPFYERFIFNISSGVILIWILDNVQPKYHQVFSTPIYLNLPLVLIGGIFWFVSLGQLGHLIMFNISLDKVMAKKQLILDPYTSKKSVDLVTSGVYGIVRHPMQLGFLLLFGFASNHYTVDRLIFIGHFYLIIAIGVYLEQKKSQLHFANFDEYKKIVPNAIIPKVF